MFFVVVMCVGEGWCGVVWCGLEFKALMLEAYLTNGQVANMGLAYFEHDGGVGGYGMVFSLILLLFFKYGIMKQWLLTPGRGDGFHCYLLMNGMVYIFGPCGKPLVG